MMNQGVRIPVRVQRGSGRQPAPPAAPAVAEAIPPVEDYKVREGYNEPVEILPRPAQAKIAAAGGPDQRGPRAATGEPDRAEQEDPGIWRDRALRLQAEMENFRKRQQRLAEDRIIADRERLLRAILSISDDLSRALSAEGGDAASLREGVDLIHRKLTRMLQTEGVEAIEALGEQFDPGLHEAVGTVPSERAGVEPDTVVEVVQAGYRLDGRVLRPVRVIVAA